MKMKMKMKFLITAAMLATWPAIADEGPYGSIGAGYTFSGGEEFELGAGNVSADTDNGFGVLGALGYDWGNNWRTEFELGYRDADYDTTGLGPAMGDVSALSSMFNVIYDFPTESRIVPYLGGGIGVALVDNEVISGALTVKGDEAGFAAQAIAGFGYEMTESAILDISYRYFRGFGLEYPSSMGTAEQDFVSHGIFAALRFPFGQRSAPIAAAPAPMAEPTRDDKDIIVYFEFDSAELTYQAQQIIQEGAKYALDGGADVIRVEGNTDTSGTKSYNDGLSRQRAAVVRQALIGYGIDAGKIVTEAYGENNPAVKSGDGVREPLNRRAEVTISFQ